MEKKILKLSVGLLTVAMLATLSFLYYFPTIHAKTLRQEEKWAEAVDEEVADNTELTDYAVEEAENVVQQDEDLNGRIKLELPGNVTGDSVTVENDYLTQTLYVKFPSDCKDYFSQYDIEGSSAHLNSVSYYREGENGVIAMDMNRLYEVESEQRDGSLYISFIDPHDIYDKVVVVDAGHGGKDAGATMAGIYEKDIDLGIVLQIKQIFDTTENPDLKIGVYYTRLDDTKPTLEQRAALANAARADLFISIHNNAVNTKRYSSANGSQVLYSQSDDSEFSSEGLARICLDHVTAACGSKNMGLMKGDDIYIIRTSEVPVALIEVGFMTNKDELAALNSEEYQKQAAQGVYDAIMEAFEEGY